MYNSANLKRVHSFREGISRTASLQVIMSRWQQTYAMWLMSASSLGKNTCMVHGLKCLLWV